MFIPREQIKKEAQRIISDSVDNDIILIVAYKGVGKAKLLKEIYGSTAYNSKLIVANGEIVKTDACSLKRCFAEGIIEYVSRNNGTAEIRKKLEAHINSSVYGGFRLFKPRKLQKEICYEALCKHSLRKLKSIYFDLAKDLPLVLISSGMVLTDEEVKYLESLDSNSSEETGARITFVLGVRATPSCIDNISRIINNRIRGIWLMPLMAIVERSAIQNDVYSMSEISIENPLGSNKAVVVNEDSLVNLLDVETYRVVRNFVDNGLNPQKIHILANQEISIKSYDYLLDVTREIYKVRPSQFDKGLVLQFDNRLLWLDVLSYYYALYKELDTAIIETQKFFFLLINRMLLPSDKSGIVIFKKLKRNSFLSFIHEAVYSKRNSIVDGFAKYYSDLAKLTKIVYSRSVDNYGNHKKNLIAIEVLDRVAVDFSAESLGALEGIYESTQICSVLDIGLEMLSSNMQKITEGTKIPDDILSSINTFVETCIRELYKWNDVTLLDKLFDFLELYSKNNPNQPSTYRLYFSNSNPMMTEMINDRIKDKVSKGVILMNPVDQNMREFWYNMGKQVVEEYKDKLNMPIGKVLPLGTLNEKLSQCEIILLTANSVENAIITRDLKKSCHVEEPEKIITDKQMYQFFTLLNHNITHIIPQRTSSFTENGSADAVRSVLSHIDKSNNKLKAIFSLGVAYGVNPKVGRDEKGQSIGDVLVSNRLIRWDAFMKTINGEIQYDDHDFVYVADEILGGCKEYLRMKDMPWSKELNIGQFNWFLGTLLCGNAVINDPDFKNALLRATERYGIRDTIIGGEMEGSGIWFSNSFSSVPIIIIKGICDWAENKNGWDFIKTEGLTSDLVKDCVQAYATQHAFKTFEFIVSQVYGQ